MKIKSLDITGFPDMIRSLFITNKTYNDEIEEKIKVGECVRTMMLNKVKSFNDLNEYEYQCYSWYTSKISLAINYACGTLYRKTDDAGRIHPDQIQQCHSTIGRFLDITCTIEGLHRGATDDFDAHAMRLNSRIIRQSTRTRKPDDLEFSDYYLGKVLALSDIIDKTVCNLDTKTFDTIELPERFKFSDDDKVYVRTKFGYVLEEYKNDFDVLRGLTPLGMSNLFTFKCNITEWAHITKLRQKGTHANPELQEMIEMVNDAIEKKCPSLNRNFWNYCIQ